MADPFAIALDALFYGPGSAAALYVEGLGTPDKIRVIRSSPDQEARFGVSRIVQATHKFELRVSEVPDPRPGEELVIGEDTFTLFGEPILDTEGLTWACGAELA